MNEDLTKKLTSLEVLIGVQRQSASSNHYMNGMLNGLICAHAIFSDSRPMFHKAVVRRNDIKVRHKSRHKA